MVDLVPCCRTFAKPAINGIALALFVLGASGCAINGNSLPKITSGEQLVTSSVAKNSKPEGIEATDAELIKTGGGNNKRQRLDTSTERRFQYIEQIAIFMRVQLVNNDAVRVQAVQRIRIGTQRLEFAGRGGDVQIILKNTDALA